ncbi:MAG: hypothetical protein B6229_05380 [Spirochaetaceae bacterium 4572_7]|nr:MAG: hypothetical protein B6229_05380 [Spirochaetaceae bacterium 4572_7]
MAAAQSVGFVPYGIDPSTEGILYIKNKLGLMAAESSFPICEALPFPTPFNGITMWYVIEHFKNLDSVLTQVNVLLPKGGVFAFSTPNISGITGLKSKRAFRHNSPQDHFTLFDPKSAKKVLKEYGFKVYKVNVTGHHPKRFGGWVRGSFLSKIIYHISRLFRLGDTFEIYSIKENNL